MRHVLNHVARLIEEEQGAQVIEYALLVGVVALTLVIALNAMTDNAGGFTQFLSRLATCLTTPACS
jgi:pilus assembly protein Flp/PilA